MTSMVERQLNLWANFTNLWNNTFDQADEFTSQLKPASDVSIHAVITSVYFNAFIFLFLLGSYEVLRRLMPSVYAARQLFNQQPGLVIVPSIITALPQNSYVPLDWVGPVFGVSWSTVRKTAGLDAYFFLRFIRMCVRITAVSTFWAMVILAPTYCTGRNGANGWYLVSMTNVKVGGWRMMVPVIFIYLFSGFTFFVLKQEFSHWMELRMDFLGRGDKHIDPQHHFSLMIENIPMELRSDTALFEYFDRLYPGKIHSASVIMNLPKLETLVAKRLRITKRLEKAISRFKATGKRPSHTMAQSKFQIFGIECGMSLMTYGDIFFSKCSGDRVIEYVNEEGPLPPPHSLVDSISLYTRELAECNRAVVELQQQKVIFGETGYKQSRESNWFIDIVDAATEAASHVMDESIEDNGLRSPHESSGHFGEFMMAENMTSKYGSFGTNPPSSSPAMSHRKAVGARLEPPIDFNDSLMMDPSLNWSWSGDSDRSARLIVADHLQNEKHANPPKHTMHPNARDIHANMFKRAIGRLGLDFFVAGLKYLNRQLDMLYANVVGTTMSSTGFVTFLDLTSVATAASTPLTHKPNMLKVSVAPEPRDIRWKSAPIPHKILKQREQYTNICLTLGIVLWSIPLTAIQAFATAEQVARIPGMEWVLTIDEGSFISFINGYLPVIALLTLIMLLPIIFEGIAIHYEHRKTVSDVQRSMLGRYFYYQLANIYLTVTAGSLWASLADIIDHPGNALEILGRSLPKVVGYFISLLITKILAGLPVVVLRVAALGRMVFLHCINSSQKLTQREMDMIYRRENLQYGWEYPSQLLVIVICFTYACICPVVLPVGVVYFAGALMVYKKQALYVYIPQYESGGSMFPDACGCMLFGLLCSQTVLIGYTVIRQAFYEPLLLMPLPVITLYVMRFFRTNFGNAATQLSLERAVERDRLSELKAKLKAKHKHNPLSSPNQSFEERRDTFDKKLYRQPVLTAPLSIPMHYRRGQRDDVTDEIQQTIEKLHLQSKTTVAGGKRDVSQPQVIPEDSSLLDQTPYVPHSSFRAEV